MNYKKEIIPLDCLLLDLENARHGTQDDQSAVFKWMAAVKNREKVMKLAQSIATHGVSPSELPIVIPAGDGGRRLYIAVEGNRRIAILKILRDPEKCPDERARKKFRKLREEAGSSLPSELECVIFPDLPSAAYWIELRHLGEQGGAGTVSWGAKEAEYFARRINRRGRYEPAMRLLEYATKERVITQEESNRIPITNVMRLINTPDVRRELGLHLRKGELNTVADRAYFEKAVGDMLKALASGDWSVSKLKGLEQRKDFVKHIKKEQNWGSYEMKDEAPILSEPSSAEGREAGGSGGPDEKKIDEKKKRTSRDSLLRKSPVSSDVRVKIENKRVRSMLRELKDIEVDKFTEASSVLTRVFIEACVDLYMQKNKLPLKKTLADKVRDVRTHIMSMNVDNNDQIKNDLKGLETFCGDANSIGSANTFNAVVHNPRFSLTGKEIRIIWNRLEPCLEWFEGHI